MTAFVTASEAASRTASSNSGSAPASRANPVRALRASATASGTAGKDSVNVSPGMSILSTGYPVGHKKHASGSVQRRGEPPARLPGQRVLHAELVQDADDHAADVIASTVRSEERRVGKE